MIKKYGLIGKKLEHSFSKNYFENKFNELQLTDHEYHLFPLEDVAEFKSLLIKDRKQSQEAESIIRTTQIPQAPQNYSP